MLTSPAIAERRRIVAFSRGETACTAPIGGGSGTTTTTIIGIPPGFVRV